MPNEPSAQHVRNVALELLVQYGAPADATLCETIMIGNGHYVGRRFSLGELSALWSVANNTIRVLDSTNRELASIPVPDMAAEPAAEAA